MVQNSYSLLCSSHKLLQQTTDGGAAAKGGCEGLLSEFSKDEKKVTAGVIFDFV